MKILPNFEGEDEMGILINGEPYSPAQARKEMDKMKIKQCADCRDGEHDNYDDEIRLVVIMDLDNRGGPFGGLVKRSYMCETHREQYAQDGYGVRES